MPQLSPSSEPLPRGVWLFLHLEKSTMRTNTTMATAIAAKISYPVYRTHTVIIRLAVRNSRIVVRCLVPTHHRKICLIARTRSTIDLIPYNRGAPIICRCFPCENYISISPSRHQVLRCRGYSLRKGTHLLRQLSLPYLVHRTHTVIVCPAISNSGISVRGQVPYSRKIRLAARSHTTVYLISHNL